MQKNQKELKAIIENLYEMVEKYKQYLVIVEGKRDKVALEELGFEHIMPLNGRPLYDVAENVQEKQVIILTDLDKKGEEIYSRIKKDLDKRGVEVDDTLRNLLFKTELRQIEGLTNYLRRFKE
ncbi:toprim domain-containing protein [Candidatus Woesearchaeota archaeon]|nr:toprim domain-containing protein [Candidatus Woesearchaeota archaeon]